MTPDPMQFRSRLVPARTGLAAEHLRGKVEAEWFVSGTPCAVSVPVLNLHLSADANAGLATQLLFGETFTVYETRSDGFSWGQAANDGYTGYVRSDGLGPAASATAAITAPRSHIYREADIKSPVLQSLPCLARLPTDGIEGTFTRLKTGGFVPSAHLTPVTGDFVDQALRFLNVPYLWGGRSFEGIDCSGLVQVALMSCGISAPRDSDMQEAWLGSVLGPDTPPQRGDLMFWKGHVGILADAQTLVHANAHHMAVALERLEQTIARIEKAGDGPVTSRKRLDSVAGAQKVPA